MIVPMIDQFIEFVLKYWYWFVIGGLGIIIFSWWRKIKQLQFSYHSEIREHHDIIKEELKLNPTNYIWLFKKDKKIGKIKGLTNSTIKKTTKKGEIEENYYDLSVAFNSLGLKDIKIWYGEKHFTIPKELIKLDFENNKITIQSGVDLERYIGYVVPPDEKTKIYVREKFHRTMADKSFDAMGNQMKNFAIIRDMWAYQMALKEKEIEKIREEKALTPMKSR